MGHTPVSALAILSSQSSPHPIRLFLLLLLLAHSSFVGAHQRWKLKDCMPPDYVPSHNLVGESLDVVTMELKGVYPVDILNHLSKSNECFLHWNPHQGDKMQTVPFNAPNWQPVRYCKTVVRSEASSSLRSGMKMGKYAFDFDWKVKLQWEMFGIDVRGKNNQSKEFVRFMNSQDQFTFTWLWHRCSFYRHSLRPKPSLDRDFEEDVKNLPRYYNSASKDQYRRFIRTYGTHYIHKVILGGQITRVAATRTCLSRINGFGMSEAERCLSLDLEVGLGLATLDPSCSKFLHNSGMRGSYSAGLYESNTEVIGGNGWSGWVSSNNRDSEGYRQWKENLKKSPVIIELSERPLYDLVNDGARRGLKEAIDEYIRERRKSDDPVSGRKPSCSLASHDRDCCPKQLGRGWLTVTIIRGSNLYRNTTNKTEGFVEITYGRGYCRTDTIESNNPVWNKTCDLGLVAIGLELTATLKDVDPFRTEKLFYCSYTVKAGSYKRLCEHRYGTIDLDYALDCGPHLTGDDCDIYKPL